MNLTADNTTQSRTTQGRAGITTNQVTCHATQYRAPAAVLRWVWVILAHAPKEAANMIKVTVFAKVFFMV